MELVFGIPIYQAGENRNIQKVKKNTSIEKQQSEEGGQKSPKQLSEYTRFISTQEQQELVEKIARVYV